MARSTSAVLRRSSVARSLWWRLHERADLRLLQRSTLFDADEYLRLNPDVLESGADPYLHYLRRGASECRESGRFWAKDYVTRYPDVQAAGTNPLIHYLRFGQREGRILQRLPAPEPAPTAIDGGAPPLQIHQPTITRVGDRLAITCQIEGAPALFAVLHGPSEVISEVVPRLEPFMPVALLMAGAARRDIVVHGPIDADYLDTLRLQCVPLLRVAFGFRETRIVVEPSGPHAPEATPPEPA